MTPAGFPHSDIAGSQDACSSPTLFAAYHVLPRRFVPRHPPCALSTLDRHSLCRARPTVPCLGNQEDPPAHSRAPANPPPPQTLLKLPHTRTCSCSNYSTPTSPSTQFCQFISPRPAPERTAPSTRRPCPGGQSRFEPIRAQMPERLNGCALDLSGRPVRVFCSEERTRHSRKEVIQPQVPLRLPCYDFAPVIKLAFDRSVLLKRRFGHGLRALPTSMA
jgi:hypothetical protein